MEWTALLKHAPCEACLTGFYLYGGPRLLESKMGYRRTYFVTILCILIPTSNCCVVNNLYILTVVVIFKGNTSEKPYGKCLGCPPKTRKSLRMWLILGIVPPGWRLRQPGVETRSSLWWTAVRPVCDTWYAGQSSHLLPSVPPHSMSPLSLQCWKVSSKSPSTLTETVKNRRG